MVAGANIARVRRACHTDGNRPRAGEYNPLPGKGLRLPHPVPRRSGARFPFPAVPRIVLRRLARCASVLRVPVPATPMKRLLPASLLLALGTAACDNPSGSPSVDRVVVSPAEHTLSVGGTVQLQAQPRASGGQVVQGAAISWNSLEPAVAGVSTSGLVTALAAGTARVVASSGSRADTAVITVVAPLTECTPATTLTLAVGESRRLSGAAASGLCLDGGAGGAEFTLVPFFQSANQRATTQLTFEGTGLQAAAGPPNPSVAPSLSLAGLGGGAASVHRDGGFHLRLREGSEPALRPLMAGARAAYARRRGAGGARFNVTAAAAPVVGTLLTLNTDSRFGTSQQICNEFSDMRTGRVEAIGARAVIVADTANPVDGMTPADYAHVAATMDTLVWPVVAGTFGEPADIDDNARVVIFYTRAVNEMTPPGVTYVVGGFFYSRDLFPRETCPLSNQAEIFYMLAADPSGTVNGHVRTTENVIRSTLGTVGHELQHLISASRRLYVIGAQSTYNEEVWLNEGLSHISEELLFYRASGLTPGSNVTLESVLASERRREAINQFGLANLGRFSAYLDAPEANSPFSPDDELATRGSAWAFLRYAADRRGGDQRQLWYDLVNNSRLGLANLQHHLGVDPRVWARDFNVALYTDDAVPGVAPELTYPSWNFRSLYPAITNPSRYPLRTRALTSSTPISLRASGAAYLRTAVTAGSRGQVRVSPAGGGVLPESVSLTVVRTR